MTGVLVGLVYTVYNSLCVVLAVCLENRIVLFGYLCRARLTLTPSKRRTSLSESPNPTDKASNVVTAAVKNTATFLEHFTLTAVTCSQSCTFVVNMQTK